jgi:type IV pilus assembly protein PilC
MVMYAYQSMDATGKRVRGNMDANNLPDLEMRLRRMELDLIDCKLLAAKSFTLGKGKVSTKDLINFCFHMEQMTSAGVPMLEGLGDLRDSTENPRFRAVIADLIENIEGGSQLSEAMSRYPIVFDRTFTALINAGEQSGRISDVFKNLSDSLKWQDELVAQTKKIIIYPAFVGTVVLSVTFFLMIFLVPQLVGFIKNMGGELPLHTRALIFVSDIFINYWYLILTLPVVFFMGFKIAVKNSPPLRYKFDGFKLRIWLVGPILHKIILSRFTTFFALMYASGITILDAIRLSEDIVNNAVVSDGLKRAGQMISEGQGVTAGFEATGIFPPLVIRMLKIGESTGQLDAALLNVSYFYNREIKEMIDRVQALIEPIMTVLLGLLLAWVMLSVLGPIYDMISKLQT